MAELSVIGKAGLKDPTLIKKLTGTLDAAGDHFLGTKLIARSLLSNIAHGKIKSIDTSAAEALLGVKAVTTYKDCPVLSDKILCWGQEVAAVAAVDEETAAQAVELINVEYTPETAVIDPDEAMAPGAPLCGVWPDSNVRTTEIVRGDIEAGFAQATVTVGPVTVGWLARFQHQEIEPQTALARWIGDHLYLWTSSQNPMGQRAGAAGPLNLPLNKVHLVTHLSGAGHGNKHSCEYGVIAAVLAKKAGMPVLYQKSRVEHILSSTRQFPAKADIKIGVKDDGTIVAMDCTFYADAASNGMMMAGGLSFGIRTTWKCPNARFKHVDIATNNPWTGYWRCVSDPPGSALQNQLLDMAAEEVGMDPLEFRLKNLVTPEIGDQDSNQPFGSLGIRECFEKAAEGIGWATKWHAPGTSTLADGRLHGIGIGGMIDSHGVNAAAWGMSHGGVVLITADGKALITPARSHCAGANIAMVHIVAETLGMNYDDVQLGDFGNTDVGPDGGMEGGSTGTATLGAAFIPAAEDARAQAFAAAAPMLGTTPDKLTAREGKIFETANPANSKTWAEVAGAFGTPPIVGRGYTFFPKLLRETSGWPAGTPCLPQGQEATAVEIAVDPETGEIEILNMVNAIDTGRAVYLRGCEKQMYGGLEIQQGEALLYEQVIEKTTGATLNPSFLDHRIATSLDVYQDRNKIAIVESEDQGGPYGAHGIGEPCVNAFCCIGAAFYNATGKWISEYPITPWRVLKALGKV